MKKLFFIILFILGCDNRVKPSDVFHTCNATAHAFAGSVVGFAGLGLFTRSMYKAGKSFHVEMDTQELIRVARKNSPMFISGLMLLGVSSYFTASSTLSERALSDSAKNFFKFLGNTTSLAALSLVGYIAYKKGKQIEKRLITLL